MAPEVASPASDCPSPLCRCVHITLSACFLVLLIIMCVYSYKDIHNGMRLVVEGGSFQMNNSQQGNVTLQFILRAENPTFRSVTYNNISGTLAVMNKDPFVRFPVADFHVKKRPVFYPMGTPTQVSTTQLSVPRIDIADRSVGLVLMLNGTMEMSSRSYRCCIWTSEDDKPCSRVRSK